MKSTRTQSRFGRWAAFAVIAGLALLPTACGDDGGSETTDESADAAGAADPGAQSGPGAAGGETAPERETLMEAYDRGLDFLATKQADGKWSVQDNPHVGVTAIAAAQFLRRPGGVREADKAMLDQSIAFVTSTLGEDGSVSDSYRPNYETSVVVMALAATGDEKYRAQIDAGAAWLKKLQRLDEGNPTYGGIGYGSDNTRSDLSNTQYALASLRAAGISEDDPVFLNALDFLNRVQNRKENETEGEPTEWVDKETGQKLVRGNDGGANYYPGNSKAGFDVRPNGVGVLRSYGSMTYALLRCYHFAGLDAEDPRVASAIEWCAENWTLDTNPGMPAEQAQEGLFYYYATMGEALAISDLDALEVPEQGSVDWRKALSGRLLSIQKDDGSWVNESSRWMEADPVLASSYALTALGKCVR